MSPMTNLIGGLLYHEELSKCATTEENKLEAENQIGDFEIALKSRLIRMGLPEKYVHDLNTAQDFAQAYAGHMEGVL